MNRSYHAVVNFQMALLQQWIDCGFAISKCYTALWDPRPDLAMPARRVELPYRWWW
jgi:hypothetical protein